ncbi:hypothetical protein P7L78_03595 (plasmid) [Tistrella bauzanensis]|uniref:hypothetical protein n=1 Tax=Tistrella bauzanensis TaxID=657419 RepID=UPI003556E410
MRHVTAHPRHPRGGLRLNLFGPDEIACVCLIEADLDLLSKPAVIGGSVFLSLYIVRHDITMALERTPAPVGAGVTCRGGGQRRRRQSPGIWRTAPLAALVASMA